MSLPYYWQNKEYESSLHEFRVALGLTINDLVERTDVSQQIISALANGTYSPISSYTKNIRPSCLRICDVLGASPEELWPRYFCSLEKKTYVDDDVIEISVGEYSHVSSAEPHVLHQQGPHAGTYLFVI